MKYADLNMINWYYFKYNFWGCKLLVTEMSELTLYTIRVKIGHQPP